MHDLTIHEIEPEIVAKLAERARQHSRTVEEEHRRILRDALFNGAEIQPPATFESYLLTFPYVGEDSDFSRNDDSMRDFELVD